MLYLLDANVLITAHNSYYPIDRIPEFWEWLVHQGSNDLVKIPIEIIEEVQAGHKNDLLYKWIRDASNRDALRLEEEVDSILLQHTVHDGYANNLTDDEIEQLGRDPFLMAYGLVNSERCVVTTEVSKPSKVRQNRHIPDVCKTLGVQCCGPFELNRTLGFSTTWNL